MVLQEVVTKADGTRLLAPVYEFATRSDGSSVFLGIQDASSAEAPVRIIQFASGVQGMISYAKRQKYLTRLSPEANRGVGQNVRKPSSRCSIQAASYRDVPKSAFFEN